ncbi:c-type cytochrome [Phragmitibacter flavus]|uniref:C-type cytochrome n=1 Tax=Phragmitibacter flavus TaxID=2576071 RepID=A0A5R8KCQ2_9BACT|nr:c-type cytochrome [Phragmitibacter flavus]TLD70072.1 c-type cytochrome [Phragmitibacter flavus]
MFLSRITHLTVLLTVSMLMGAELGDGGGAVTKSKQNNITVPPELKAEVWAGAAMLANPVAFAFDEKGRMFLAETHRQGVGVPDNRAHAYWLEDDVKAQSVEDRVKKYEKWQHRTPLTTFTGAGEMVRMIADSNGDGVADLTTDFAGPFNEVLDGTAAGLIVKDGEVWFTCIPHVWKLSDKDGDGKAEVKDKVFTGFGVRDAFRGHDLHGLVWGPDGRLYFSMADRGYNIPMPDGSRLRDPMDDGRGAVFRCWPDGTGLEVFAKGLRNPQELAFDALGNLFTVDNNGDSGDRARLVHVVEGGDTGWCMTYQYGTPAITEGGKYGRGPWDAEGLWHLQTPEQAAWILPPVAHITDGPSGLVYYPGVTAIGDEKYADSFFICDFKGAAANSGVWNFSVERNGAGFAMKKIDKFVWNVLATDCDFAPDGRFYVSDFIDGWTGKNEGYIFAVADEKLVKDAKVLEVKEIFEEGFAKRDVVDLAGLLNHADMRVRLRVQYALAEKGGDEVLAVFVKQAKEGVTVPARLHGVWGLGSLRHQVTEVVEVLVPMLDDADVNLRTQVAKTLGDLKGEPIAGALLARFELEQEAAVFAELGIALGKQLADSKDAVLKRKAQEVAVAVWAKNADKDVVLRHAMSMLLSGVGDRAALAGLSKHENRSVRMGAVLALRRLLAPELREFLADEDDLVVTETARAIYDANVVEALPALAAVLANEKTVGAGQALTLRAVNAAMRVGDAKVLSEWASNAKAPEASRREALFLLAHWAEPSPFERVVGFHRPLEKRDVAPALAALSPHLLELLGTTGKVADEALRAALALRAKLPGSLLVSLLKDGKRDASTRSEALRLLAQEKDAALGEGLEISAAAGSPAELRIAAAILLAETDADKAVKVLGEVVKSGKTAQQQQAVAALAAMKDDRAQMAVVGLMDELLAGRLPSTLKLDVLTAAETVPAAKEKLTAWQARLPADNMFAAFDVSLDGGDPVRGKDLFANHTAAQCMRCHKVSGGGGLAGPELSKIAGRLPKEKLLESVINPSAVIAPGYGIASVTLKDGSSLAGILKAEDAQSVTILDGEGKEVKVQLADIASRTPAISSMPPMFALLTKQEIRDLVAYLATLK